MVSLKKNKNLYSVQGCSFTPIDQETSWWITIQIVKWFGFYVSLPKRLYSDRKRGSPYSFQIQKMQSCRMVTHTMVAHWHGNLTSNDFYQYLGYGSSCSWFWIWFWICFFKVQTYIMASDNLFHKLIVHGKTFLD